MGHTRENDFLGRMIAQRREAMHGVSEELCRCDGECVRMSFREALAAGGEVAVVAEVKKASPSAGAIAPDVDVVEQARAYQAGGASAVSVLTEPAHFGGSFEDLCHAKCGIDVPVLAKDFVVSPEQVYLASTSNADAVLLMVSVLGDETASYAGRVHALGMETFVEVHDAEEYEIASAAGADVLGVNARDLTTLQVDREGAFELIGRARRDGHVVVAESGVGDRAHVQRAGEAGAHAVLVGELLMRSPDPEAAVRALTGVVAPAGAWE